MEYVEEVYRMIELFAFFGFHFVTLFIIKFFFELNVSSYFLGITASFLISFIYCNFVNIKRNREL
jgi:hypothetical protein